MKNTNFKDIMLKMFIQHGMVNIYRIAQRTRNNMRPLTLLTLILLLSSCYVGILDPTPTPAPTITLPPVTPWATNTHTPTQTPTDEPTPTQEVTLEAPFTACVSGSYAVAKWDGFTLYEFPNLTGDTITLDESNLLGYFPFQSKTLPITVVLLIEKDAIFGTWYVVIGVGNPVYGWISPDVLTPDCQY